MLFSHEFQVEVVKIEKIILPTSVRYLKISH